ncbi:hypothetical protein CKN53_04310 [Acinetobacter baumannii]|uniref:hypothetical protein n=1 Tax=Acinetobacter baumannii TaxID=470 RepID=UPI000C07CD8A|nr:hypothetical protein [Acinetobacter baumannii]MBC6785704.1 hypothetical protein [Acinetobacter baumannii]MBC6812788.1 hypothetical protein [Acinetobacter baumannii]MBC6825063.1 hypothetical protein [Acinetobacter baumannii]PHP83901.1 hypothetical protein CKN52_04875 [Acinetobacter baumannii]RLS20311.1 hypothetical protein CKN53_04310 [Acinetobacter baumannii]
MNAQTQDQSYFKMIAEHQELSARALRLHEVLNQHACVRHMPTEACTLINEMKNIVETGTAQPGGLESAELDFGSELPFTDPEVATAHDFNIGDTVWMPNEFARYKFIVSSHQRFEVKQIVGTDQLYVCHIDNPKIPFTNNQKCFTAHFSHFAKIEGAASCVA